MKKFKSTCLISFANTVLVQCISSNLHQKCSFEQFKMHQNCDWSLILEKKCTKTAISKRKGIIKCQCPILVRLKWFEWALLVQIRTNTLYQNCVCEGNQTRASELLQTLFCTKNGSPRTWSPKKSFYVFWRAESKFLPHLRRWKVPGKVYPGKLWNFCAFKLWSLRNWWTCNLQRFTIYYRIKYCRMLQHHRNIRYRRRPMEFFSGLPISFVSRFNSHLTAEQ